nr:hypothetical protein Ycf80 [Echinothamnion sp.]
MILFNFILFYKLGQSFLNNEKLCHPQLTKEYRDTKNEYINQYSKLNSYNNIFISKSSIDNTKVSYSQLTKEIDNPNLLSRNFWQKLVNKYLQETIFLSSVNTLSTSYILQLKASGLSVYKNNEYKNFLYKFSKDLLHGKINVTANNTDHLTNLTTIYKDNIYLKYKWFKSFNFENFILSSFKLDLLNFFKVPTVESSNSLLPLFVVINDNQEIIISESTDQLSKSRGFFNRFSYSIQPNRYDKSLYLGLLFVNPQDAIEYRNYIKANYFSSTLSNNINVVPANMQLYNNLMILRNRNIEFRLIPDLTEISDLIYKYKKHKNVSFNIKQKYSNHSFQGQPIYFIKPLYVKKKFSNYVKKLEYLYTLKKDQTTLKYQAAFFNYKTLMGAWKKFKQEHNDYNLPYIPDISVSNFEAFIYNKDYQKNYSNIIFLPSLQTYDFICKYSSLSLEHTQGFKSWLLSRSVSLKTLIFRVFWSLTSRQPTNW